MHDVRNLLGEKYAHRYCIGLHVGNDREDALQDRTDARQNHEVLETIRIRWPWRQFTGNVVTDQRRGRQRQPVADTVAYEHVPVVDLAEREVVDSEYHEQEAGY